MPKFLLLIGLFMCVTLFGAWSTEQVRIEFAKEYGYSARYVKGFGRNVFNNHKLGLEYDAVAEEYGSYAAAKETNQWRAIADRDYAGHAEIELPIKFFTVGLSVLGFIWFLGFLQKEPMMTWKHWVSFFMSFCFMREVVLATVNIFLAYPCGEAKAFDHLGIEPFLAQKIILITGLIFLGLIVFTLPKKIRLSVIAAGAIGSVTGLLLWLFWLGPILFN